MDRNKTAAGRLFRHRGVMAVLAAFVLSLMFILVALAVDIGAAMCEQSRMQLASDAASLAGVDVVGEGGTSADVQNIVDFYIAANGLVLDGDDELVVEQGAWNKTTRSIDPAPADQTDAVRVLIRPFGRRTFIGRFIGRDILDVEAESTARIMLDDKQDVAVVIDCSNSMADFNRMTYTRSAALALINALSSNDRVSICAFSWPDPADGNRSTGHIETGLNLDHAPAANCVGLLTPGYYGGGNGTNIAGGMRAGLEALAVPRLSGEEAKKVLLVLTDGHATRHEPPGTDPWNSIDYYADVARNQKVVLHGVTLGSDAAGAALASATRLDGRNLPSRRRWRPLGVDGFV